MIERELYTKLDQLLLSGNAGPVHVLAKKMELKPRQVKYMFEVLRIKYGCPVKYFPATKKYQYATPGSFTIGFGSPQLDSVLAELDNLRKMVESLKKKSYS